MTEDETGPYINESEIDVFKRCVIYNKEHGNKYDKNGKITKAYEEEEERIKPYIDNYKMYGPSNPRVNSGREDEEFEFCPYVDNGICYMLTCKCTPDDPDNPHAAWYNGKCNYVDNDGHPCKVVFHDKTEAWRTPLESGGFNGCFCRDHFRRCVQRPINKEEFSLYHTLCDICIMIRERYPIQSYSSNNSNYDVSILCRV